MTAQNERSFRIAPATRDDVPGLQALIRSLARYERLEAVCVSTEGDLARALFGPRPVAEALIARLDAESHICAGFALFFHTYSTFLGRPSLWLEDLFVTPGHRRRGIGRALLGALAALATERNCGRFEWAVLDWNEPAIRFYESLGATVLPDWRIARVTGESLAGFASRASASQASPQPGPAGADSEVSHSPDR